MNDVIQLPTGDPWRRKRPVAQRNGRHFVSPGELITRDADVQKGHGTEKVAGGDGLVATVAGLVQYIDKLVMVQPLKTRCVFSS